MNEQEHNALQLCVDALDQLLPYLAKVPADVGLSALMAARPLLKQEPAPAQPALNSDCEWCAGAGKDPFGEKCEHCQTAPQHPDDAAVDRFAAAMKAKLAVARAKGRGGWDDPNVCSVEFLAQLLVEHLGKGNAGTFEDVANFAMMLHQRGADPMVLAEAAEAPIKKARGEALELGVRALESKSEHTEPAPAQDEREAKAWPALAGIGRDSGHPRAVVLYLRHEPSDEHLRMIQEALRTRPAQTEQQPEQSKPNRRTLQWVVDRWHAEVANRPLVNVHRRTLDSTWRQMIRHLGEDDVVLLGPRHDDMLDASGNPLPQYAAPIAQTAPQPEG